MTKTTESRRMLSQREVANRAGVSTRTLLTWRQKGRMPEPRRLSERTLRWDADEIDEWLASK